MPDSQGNKTFISTILSSAQKAEENSYMLKGRADALRDIVKYIQDSGITIIYPESKDDPQSSDK